MVKAVPGTTPAVRSPALAQAGREGGGARALAFAYAALAGCCPCSRGTGGGGAQGVLTG
jgi:hypothetical protein